MPSTARFTRQYSKIAIRVLASEFWIRVVFLLNGVGKSRTVRVGRTRPGATVLMQGMGDGGVSVDCPTTAREPLRHKIQPTVGPVRVV